ncbi:MAG: CHRD domain-containing protein [Isosphaeraceae bacterium]
MASGRRRVERRLQLEAMEDRLAPSGGAAHSVGAAPLQQPEHGKSQTYFVAILSSKNMVAPEIKNPPPLPPANDPASGRMTFTVKYNGQTIDVSGRFSNISNVAAVTLNDTRYPGDPASPDIGVPVELLLKPGNNSGPISASTFFTVIKAPYLIGPLVNHPLSALIKDIQAGDVYVNVQTDNGLNDSNPDSPVGPGNFTFGEMRGTLV